MSKTMFPIVLRMKGPLDEIKGKKETADRVPEWSCGENSKSKNSKVTKKNFNLE